MGAVTLVPDPTPRVSTACRFPPTALSFPWSPRAAFVILGISLAAAAIDSRAKGAIRRQKVLLSDYEQLENMSQGLCMFDAGRPDILFVQRALSRADGPDRVCPLQGRYVCLTFFQRPEALELNRWDERSPIEFFTRSGGKGASRPRHRDQESSPGKDARSPACRSADEGWRPGYDLRASPNGEQAQEANLPIVGATRCA